MLGRCGAGTVRRNANSGWVTIMPRCLFATNMVLILLAGCGPGAGTPVAPKLAARADVIVTLDGARHTCLVALYNEEHGSAVPCGDVASFVREELRVPNGSIFDIRVIPDVKEEEIAGVGAKLKTAGYRFIGGRQVPF